MIIFKNGKIVYAEKDNNYPNPEGEYYVYKPARMKGYTISDEYANKEIGSALRVNLGEYRFYSPYNILYDDKANSADYIIIELPHNIVHNVESKFLKKIAIYAARDKRYTIYENMKPDVIENIIRPTILNKHLLTVNYNVQSKLLELVRVGTLESIKKSGTYMYMIKYNYLLHSKTTINQIINNNAITINDDNIRFDDTLVEFDGYEALKELYMNYMLKAFYNLVPESYFSTHDKYKHEQLIFITSTLGFTVEEISKLEELVTNKIKANNVMFDNSIIYRLQTEKPITNILNNSLSNKNIRNKLLVNSENFRHTREMIFNYVEGIK